MTSTAEVPALTPEVIRALMRGHLTVVKPGETLIIRPDRDWTPNQVAEYQRVLDHWHHSGDLPFRVVALPGEEFAPVTGEPGKEKLTFEFEGKGWLGTPVVNGRRVCSAESFDVHVSCREVPAVTLKLLAPDGLRLLLAGARVSVDDETREALMSLGWTPPEEGS